MSVTEDLLSQIVGIVNSFKDYLSTYITYAVGLITGVLAIWFFRGAIAHEAVGWLKKLLILLVLDSMYRLASSILGMQTVVILETRMFNDGLFKIMNVSSMQLVSNSIAFSVSALIIFWIIGHHHMPGHHVRHSNSSHSDNAH